MKKNYLYSKKTLWYGLTCLIVGGVSCNKEPQQELINTSKEQGATYNIVALSYEVEATTRYIYDVKEDFSDLDIASMVPTRTKSNVFMKIDTKGEVYMEIEDVPVEQPVEILHKTLPDESPKIQKTIINQGVATFFTHGGKELSTAVMEIPNQLKVVQRLNEVGKCVSQEDIDYVIATMQGQMFAENLEEFILNAQRDGSQIEELNEQYLTIRTPLSKVDANCTYETVLLLDRINNRFLGTKIYNESGEEVLATMFGYGPKEDPSLKAIRQVSKESIPSGKSVKMETITRFEKLNLKINL